MSNENLLKPKLPLMSNFRKKITFICLLMAIVPFMRWNAFTVGIGQVTTINPNDRILPITAPVNGFIQNWYIKEGEQVVKGQLLAELVDNDPSFLERLEKERDANLAGVSSAKLMMDTAEINFKRQEQLYKQGLTSRKEFEKSKIEHSKLVLEHAKAIATLTKAETQLSRQSTQRVISPRDGQIARIMTGEGGQLIKSGGTIAVLIPNITPSAIEVWIDGNDNSMIRVGQKAQIQFEGWPAVQIPGWPSVAIGTFPGKVYLLDQASSIKGKFRVLIVPDGSWPSADFLRLGSKAKAYIAMAKSSIGREVWRQLTGFPPILEGMEDELSKIKKSEGEEEKKDVEAK